jgi:acylphosphatase
MASDEQGESQAAIIAEVTGDDLQQVGFRAMVMKNAIAFNLAGSAANKPDGTVEVKLQGHGDGIDQALDAMREGSKKSSQDNTVSVTAVTWDETLSTFTIIAWTSASRNITTPYDLVFTVRTDGSQISRHDAKSIWNDIALATLKGQDREKFLSHLQHDDE